MSAEVFQFPHGHMPDNTPSDEVVVAHIGESAGVLFLDHSEDPPEIIIIQSNSAHGSAHRNVAVYSAPAESTPRNTDYLEFDDIDPAEVAGVVTDENLEANLGIGQSHERIYQDPEGRNVAVIIRNVGSTAVQPNFN